MGLRLWDKAGRVIAGCAGILVLAACQTAVSVEEAKQITASFEGGSFVPPPRTVGDITAILDDQKLTDPGKTGELVAKADAGPPEGEDATTLARFHLNRGQAARSIGRDSQALEDLRTAFRHLKGARLDPRERIRLLLNLASAEGSAGNHRNAVRLMERAVEAKPNPGAYRQLVGLYARGGDLGTAERAWKRGKELIARLGQRRNVKPKSLARLSIELARLDHLFLESQGRWRAAETALRRAIETRKKSYRGKGDVSWLPARQKQLARNLGKQGRFVEAEVVARGALLDALANIGRNNSITADVVRVLAGVLLTQGRYDEAEKLGRAAIDIHGRSGMPKGSRKVAQVRRFLIDVLAANEDWTGVMEEVALARADMTGNPKLLKKMFGRILGVALALLATDRAEEAQRMLSTAHDANKRRLGAKHDKTARWGALLAMAEAATGDQRAALAGFREAVPVLLSRSRRSDDEDATEGVAEQRLGLVLESYIGLLADIRGTALEREAGIDAAAQAFRIADGARSRTVQRALAASGARTAARDPELADLVRREQDAAKQVAALYGRLADVLAAPTDQQDADAVDDLRIRIDQLRGARAALARISQTP